MTTECVLLSREIVEVYQQGNKVLICGNGGLAAESEHFAAELMGKYGRDVYIPCISLTGPSSLITALANDIGFEYVFEHQVQTLGKRGDLLIGMTTSNSANILKAICAGDANGLRTFILHGPKTPMEEIRHIGLVGDNTAEIQENIIRFLHEVAREAKELIFADAVH